METTNKPIKFIATYARVSTSKQEDEKTIQNQVTEMQKYADENKYIIVEKYVDEGWSGDILARPDLDRLRVDAKKKIWDAVLVYDPDRLARRGAWQEVVIEELKERGIDVLFVTIPKPQNDEDVIMYKMRGVFSEYERMKINERFRIGKVSRVNNGHVLVSEAPYGYKYILNNGKRGQAGYIVGHYVINEEEAITVKKIFSWIANDKMTIRGIVKKLQEMGIKPRKNKRSVWNTSTLGNMLRNETYIGKARWGSSYAVVPEKPLKNEKYKKIKKSSKKIRPRDKWLFVDVPPIVDVALFEKARKQMEENFALCRRNKKNEYLLAGRIECPCGRRRTGEGISRGEHKHLYYRCADRVLSFPLPRTCKEPGINAVIADKLYWEKFVEFVTSPKLLTQQVERWFNSRQEKTKNPLVDIPILKEKIEKLKKQETRYDKAYGAEVITFEQLKEYTEPLKEEINKIEIQIANAKQEASEQKVYAVPSEEEIKNFADQTKRTINNLDFSTKRAIILSTVGKVVGMEKSLFVTGSLPLNLNYEYKLIHSNSADTINNNYVEYKTINRHCRFA